MNDMQARVQDHQSLLNQLTGFGATQGQLLDTLREELRWATKPIPLSGGRQSTGGSSEPNPFQSSTNDNTSETNAYRPTTVALHFTKHDRKGCKCPCHRSKRVRSPSFLSHIFGSFFIGYVGFPSFSKDGVCKNCQGADTKGSIADVFPRWLLAIAIMTRMEYSQRKGPQLLIRCLRVRPQSSVPFQANAQAQWGQVGILIKTGQASALDITENGNSLLLVSRSIGYRSYSYVHHV